MDRNGKPYTTRVGIMRDIPEKPMAAAEIVRQKLSPDFITAMRNRVLVGAARYSGGAGQFESKESGDSFVERARQKLNLFEKTRNAEYLVDIAVYANLLYLFDDRRHFEPEDLGRPDEEDTAFLRVRMMQGA